MGISRVINTIVQIRLLELGKKGSLATTIATHLGPIVQSLYSYNKRWPIAKYKNG